MAKGDIFVRIGVDVSALEKALHKATEHIEKFGRQMKKIGRDLTEAITVPIVGLGYAAMRASADASAQFERFSARTKLAMGRLGDDIAKAVNLEEILGKVGEGIEKLIGWFTKLDNETKKVIVSTAAYAAAVGPVLMVTGRMVEAVGAITNKIGFFAFLVYKVIASLTILVAKFGVWPILIIAAVAGLVELAGGWEKVAGKAKEAWAWIEKAVKESAKYLAGSVLRTKGIPGTGFGVAPQSIGMAVNKPRALNEAPAGVEDVRDADTGQLNLFPYLGNTGFADMMEKMNQYIVRGTGYMRELGAVTAATAQQFISGITPAVQQTATVMDTLKARIEEIPPLAVQLGNAIFGFMQQISQGIGNALAQVIVYGASMGQTMKILLKSIAASIISTLISIGVQYLITSAIKKATDLADAASATASAVTTTYAEVYAQTSSLPFGWIIAAGVAAGAVALLIAGLAGAGGAAEGGIFTHSGMTRIAEKGKPEIVLNQDNVRKFMGGALGGGSQSIVIYLDSDVLVEKVVRGMPEFLRLQGAI